MVSSAESDVRIADGQDGKFLMERRGGCGQRGFYSEIDRRGLPAYSVCRSIGGYLFRHKIKKACFCFEGTLYN